MVDLCPVWVLVCRLGIGGDEQREAGTDPETAHGDGPDRPPLIQTVRGIGYALRPPP